MAKVIALWPATETAIAWIHPRHMWILPTAWRANPRIRGNIPHSVETFHAYVETPHTYVETPHARVERPHACVERPHACVKTFYILVETIHSLWRHSTFLWSHQKVPTLVWKLSTYVWKQSTPCGNIPRFRRLIAKYPHQCGNIPRICGNNLNPHGYFPRFCGVITKYPHICGNIPHICGNSLQFVDTFHISVEWLQNTHTVVDTFHMYVETIYTLWEHSMFLWSDCQLPTVLWKLSTDMWKQPKPHEYISRFCGVIVNYPRFCGDIPRFCREHPHIVETSHILWIQSTHL